MSKNTPKRRPHKEAWVEDAARSSGPQGKSGTDNFEYEQRHHGLPNEFSLNRLREVTGATGVGAAFQWGGGGRLLSSTTRGGLAVAQHWGYDSASGRISSLAYTAAGSELGAFGFQWDTSQGFKRGREVLHERPGWLTSSLGWSWRGDAANRLTTAMAGQWWPSRFPGAR